MLCSNDFGCYTEGHGDTLEDFKWGQCGQISLFQPCTWQHSGEGTRVYQTYGKGTVKTLLQ